MIGHSGSIFSELLKHQIGLYVVHCCLANVFFSAGGKKKVIFEKTVNNAEQRKKGNQSITYIGIVYLKVLQAGKQCPMQRKKIRVFRRFGKNFADASFPIQLGITYGQWETGEYAGT